jgi:hypothetical protein
MVRNFFLGMPTSTTLWTRRTKLGSMGFGAVPLPILLPSPTEVFAALVAQLVIGDLRLR